MDIRNIIAKRAAQELKDGQVVSLGVGIPTLIANHVPPGVDVVILTPNGAIGVGPAAAAFCGDPDRANASGEPITLKAGGSYFDSAKSYGVLRGGHTDMTFLGTFQVDSQGTIASYEVPGKMVAGMGGAMELLAGAKVVNVVTEHCSMRREQAGQEVHLSPDRRGRSRRGHHRAGCLPALPGQGLCARGGGPRVHVG